jgi:hypothetical protein
LLAFDAELAADRMIEPRRVALSAARFVVDDRVRLERLRSFCIPKLFTSAAKAWHISAYRRPNGLLHQVRDTATLEPL